MVNWTEIANADPLSSSSSIASANTLLASSASEMLIPTSIYPISSLPIAMGGGNPPPPDNLNLLTINTSISVTDGTGVINPTHMIDLSPGPAGSLVNIVDTGMHNFTDAGIININGDINSPVLLTRINLAEGGLLILSPEVEPESYVGTLSMDGGTIHLNGVHLTVGTRNLPSLENALTIEFAGETRGKITFVKNSVDELRNLLVNREAHIKDCKMIVIPASMITVPILLECLEYIKNTPDIQRIHLHSVAVGPDSQKFVNELLQIITLRPMLQSISLSGNPFGFATFTESATALADDFALRAETRLSKLALALTLSNPDEHQTIEKLRRELPDKKQILKDALPMMPLELCELTFQYAALGIQKVKKHPKELQKEKKKEKELQKFS